MTPGPLDRRCGRACRASGDARPTSGAGHRADRRRRRDGHEVAAREGSTLVSAGGQARATSGEADGQAAGRPATEAGRQPCSGFRVVRERLERVASSWVTRIANCARGRATGPAMRARRSFSTGRCGGMARSSATSVRSCYLVLRSQAAESPAFSLCSRCASPAAAACVRCCHDAPREFQPQEHSVAYLVAYRRLVGRTFVWCCTVDLPVSS